MRTIKTYNRQLIGLEDAGQFTIEETGCSDAPWTIDLSDTDALNVKNLYIRFKLDGMRYSLSVESLAELLEKHRDD